MEGEESRAECILTHVTEVTSFPLSASQARLYDNRTLRLVKTVPLDLVATRSAQDVQGTVSVGLDLDILTVRYVHLSVISASIKTLSCSVSRAVAGPMCGYFAFSLMQRLRRKRCCQKKGRNLEGGTEEDGGC